MDLAQFNLYYYGKYYQKMSIFFFYQIAANQNYPKVLIYLSWINYESNYVSDVNKSIFYLENAAKKDASTLFNHG